ncbi:unnamed protein product, partial [Symbiodinium sp. KB8]
AGTDGGTFPMEAGNTDNSKTADLGTTGMLTAGRCIKTNICILPKMTGDITGDRGST